MNDKEYRVHCFIFQVVTTVSNTQVLDFNIDFIFDNCSGFIFSQLPTAKNHVHSKIKDMNTTSAVYIFGLTNAFDKVCQGLCIGAFPYTISFRYLNPPLPACTTIALHLHVLWQGCSTEPYNVPHDLKPGKDMRMLWYGWLASPDRDQRVADPSSQSIRAHRTGSGGSRSHTS